jgi:putative peptide zinc metalloprotease protein
MGEPFLSSSWYRVAGLRPKLRPHTQIHRHRYRGQAYYVLQDHASGRMHRFRPAAYLFIGRMDGTRTVDAIWSEVVEQLEDDAPTQDEIVQLLSQLHAADILQSDVTPDAGELFERYAKQQTTFRRNLRNPFAITLPLWDPDALLERTLPVVGLLLGWAGAILWLLVVVPAVVLAAVHWPDLTHSLSDRVLAPANLILIALVYPVVKALHELGHAYACKARGGEVHQLGIMLLVFFPAPYVDASAATAFDNKWQRAAVGAAGILVEVFLAALALYAWILLEPSTTRAIAFNVMLIAGVSTVVFNGNPLLRFDGYYVLADLIEIPNLAQRSARFWAHLADRYLFATPDAEAYPAAGGERAWLMLYSPASLTYRLVVLLGIVLFVAGKFFIIGVVIAGWGVVTSLLVPLGKMLAHVLKSPRLHRNRHRAVGVTFGAVTGILGVLFMVPIPLHTVSEGVVWLPDNAEVRAGSDGFVRRLLAEPGHRVHVGDPLIESEDPTLAAQIQLFAAGIEALEARLTSQLVVDRVGAEVTHKELDKQQSAFARAKERADNLVARSATEGRFIVPRPRDVTGRFHRQGEVLGYVVEPVAHIVRVVVSQDDSELVHRQLRTIEIKLADRPAATYAAAILHEVPAATDQLPSKALAGEGGGIIAADPRDPKGVKTFNRYFQIDLALPPDIESAAFGARAYVRFDHVWEPLAWRLYRRARQLLLSHFDI